MGTGKQYDDEFKTQAIKLAKEVGNTAAANELGVPKGTLGTWMRKARSGEIDREHVRQRSLLILHSSCKWQISE